MTERPSRSGRSPCQRWDWSSWSASPEAGKSTFARTHFKPTEVISATSAADSSLMTRTTSRPPPDAFDVLNYIVGTAAAPGLLTVVDATNVQPAARAARQSWPRAMMCSSTRS